MVGQEILSLIDRAERARLLGSSKRGREHLEISTWDDYVFLLHLLILLESSLSFENIFIADMDDGI